MNEEELCKQVQEERESERERERERERGGHRGRDTEGVKISLGPSGRMGVDVSERWSLSQQMAEDPFS